MYYLIYGLLYLISLVPLPILYLLSDFAFFILYYVVQYRKKVVMDNLTIAFPEKSEDEKKIIAKKFYHNFTDTFIEAIKMISISRKEVEKRIKINPESVKILEESKKNIQVHAMHTFNWEVVNLGMAGRIPFPFLVVYMAIGNPYLERLFVKMRSKMGTILISAGDFKSKFHQYTTNKYALVLVADQTPGSPANAYWVSLFGKLTPFLTGPEKGARLNDCAVVFCNFFKTRRGYYEIELHTETLEPRDLKRGELTLRFVRYMESCIRRRPDNYLWSHKRWKWPYKDEYARQLVKDEEFA
jgi:Kdo2-lipid IVA lauroyltransferase/acyltransferase